MDKKIERSPWRKRIAPVSAAALGLPLAYYYMQRWLSEYVYRVSITPDLLIIATLVAAFVAIATVVAQSLKVALSNPVNSLRYE